jgi:hypothetical protein
MDPHLFWSAVSGSGSHWECASGTGSRKPKMTHKKGVSEEMSCFEVLDVLLSAGGFYYLGCPLWRSEDKCIAIIK